MDVSKVRKLALLAICSMPTVGACLECATSQCYLNAYSEAEPASLPELQGVKDIYEKMTRTIGSTRAMRSSLLVIESNSSPWAVALSDNTVVITSGTIKAMYDNSERDVADARAAFILGHELSHLETDDLFHHRAFSANEIANDITNESGQSALQFFQQRPDEEIRADLRGFTYATVAGFQTNLLLTGESDFFRNWLPNSVNFAFKKNGSNNEGSNTHPSNDKRGLYLAEGFEDILRDTPYYRYATLLAHFGHYTQAQSLFEDFLNHVETEEAFSNLGYVHLQRARDDMPIGLAYKYWIPTVLEPSDGLNIPRERGLFDQEMPASALHHLKKAEQYLKQAINMDNEQLVSHINLAAVYLYIPDKIHHAFAAIEDAKRTQLGKVPAIQRQLESIAQMVRLEVNRDDERSWPNARDTLEQFAGNPQAADNLLYNFARMLDDKGQEDTASQYWARLYQRLDSLPRPYQSQVCFRLPDKQCSTSKHATYPTPKMSPELFRDVRYPEAREYLSKEWNTNSPRQKILPSLSAQIFLNDTGDSLLALDNQVEMMIVRSIPTQYNDLGKLQAKFGSPTVSLPVDGGQILSYGGLWAALVESGKVTEIWIANLSATDSGN